MECGCFQNLRIALASERQPFRLVEVPKVGLIGMAAERLDVICAMMTLTHHFPQPQIATRLARRKTPSFVISSLITDKTTLNTWRRLLFLVSWAAPLIFISLLSAKYTSTQFFRKTLNVSRMAVNARDGPGPGTRLGVWTTGFTRSQHGSGRWRWQKLRQPASYQLYTYVGKEGKLRHIGKTLIVRNPLQRLADALLTGSKKKSLATI